MKRVQVSTPGDNILNSPLEALVWIAGDSLSCRRHRSVPVFMKPLKEEADEPPTAVITKMLFLPRRFLRILVTLICCLATCSLNWFLQFPILYGQGNSLSGLSFWIIGGRSQFRSSTLGTYVKGTQRAVKS